MKTWARWIAGAAAAATLVGGPALAQDYNAYPGAPPPGQGAYAPQPQDQYQQGYDQDNDGDDWDERQDDLDFRGSLSPYGQWISVPGVGQVWRPYEQVVGQDFQPYASSGHWVYTDYGWSWQSDYPWGWAPFHYGRWVYRPRWGWMWRPGRRWGPAWVEWRQGAGYVGWAPMGPSGVEWVEPASRPAWCFVDTPNFVSVRLSSVILAPERVRMVFGTTAPIRARHSYDVGSFYAGPPLAHVATAVGHPIAPVAVSSGHFGWRGHPVSAPPPAGMPMGGHLASPPPGRGDDRREWRDERREERHDARPVYVAPPPGRGGNDWHEERREERGGGRPVYVAPPPPAKAERREERREEKREEKHEDHDNGRHEGDHHGRGR